MIASELSTGVQCHGRRAAHRCSDYISGSCVCSFCRLCPRSPKQQLPAAQILRIPISNEHFNVGVRAKVHSEAIRALDAVRRAKETRDHQMLRISMAAAKLGATPCAHHAWEFIFLVQLSDVKEEIVWLKILKDEDLCRRR